MTVVDLTVGIMVGVTVVLAVDAAVGRGVSITVGLSRWPLSLALPAWSLVFFPW